jgi:hypothetical protein
LEVGRGDRRESFPSAAIATSDDVAYLN